MKGVINRADSVEAAAMKQHYDEDFADIRLTDINLLYI